VKQLLTSNGQVGHGNLLKAVITFGYGKNPKADPRAGGRWVQISKLFLKQNQSRKCCCTARKSKKTTKTQKVRLNGAHTRTSM